MCPGDRDQLPIQRIVVKALSLVFSTSEIAPYFPKQDPSWSTCNNI
jgi:hypothetical protein